MYKGEPKKSLGIVKKKNYLQYSYKFENFVSFRVLPPVTGCNNPSTAPTAGNII
jgi:hypothetical protein